MTKFLMGSGIMLAVMALPSIAFAQDATTPMASSDYLIMALGAVVGFGSMAYNTGSIFGKKTIPKPWLPYVGAAVTFLGAADFALPKGTSLTWTVLFVATIAGIKALSGAAGGAAFHSMLTAHKSSRGVAAAGGSSPPSGGIPVDPTVTATPAANDAVPPTPKTSAYRAMPFGGTRVALFSIAFKRMLRRLIPVAFATGIFTIGASTGASCGSGGGQITPQEQAQIAASVKLGACIESTYATDSQKTPPPAALQIALDIATVCGAEVPDVVNAFAATAPTTSAVASSATPSRAKVVEAAQANPTQVHIAVLAFHQNLVSLAAKAVPATSSSTGH